MWTGEDAPVADAGVDADELQADHHSALADRFEHGVAA
jgi:hypothetical protein